MNCFKQYRDFSVEQGRSMMTVLYLETKRNLLFAVVAVGIVFTAGLLTGHFGLQTEHEGNSVGGQDGIKR